MNNLKGKNLTAGYGGVDIIKDINLDKIEDADASFCCTLVLAAIGYPGEYKKGFYIDHSDVIENNNLKIFHAGTTLKNSKFLQEFVLYSPQLLRFVQSIDGVLCGANFLVL